MVKRLLVAGVLLCGAVHGVAQAPDRSQPPAPGPAPAFTMPDVIRRTLSNGLPVWVVRRPEVPVVQIDLVAGGGAALEAVAEAGLASLTADLLDEGAGERDALELADALEFLGAELTTGVSMDASVVGLHVPVARLGDALPLLADVVRRPRFAPADLERRRNERVTALVQARDEVGEVADAAFLRSLYGPSHRYGVPVAGTTATLRSLTGDQVRESYRRLYRADRSVLLAVGDVSPESLVPLLERAFGSWSAPPTAVAEPDAVQPAGSGKRRLVIVDHPGAAQSAIRIGRVGVSRSTTDYFPVTVMNTVLGGAFTSRLNQNLRQTHGYTYGAYSQFVMRRAAGPFVAQAAVQTDKTAEAVREFFNEFAGMQRPLPGPEIAKARSYVALRFPGQFMTTRDITGQLGALFVHGLPEQYYSTYVERILAVDAEAAGRVAARYVTPDTFLVVIAGDRRQIEAPLRALALGPVELASIDDVMGPLPQP
jgi:predicted Zn-dependent peptidase